LVLGDQLREQRIVLCLIFGGENGKIRNCGHAWAFLNKNAGRERRLVRRLVNFYNQYRMPFQAISGKLMNLKVI
jgi:hypothetical protein